MQTISLPLRSRLRLDFLCMRYVVPFDLVSINFNKETIALLGRCGGSALNFVVVVVSLWGGLNDIISRKSVG